MFSRMIGGGLGCVDCDTTTILILFLKNGIGSPVIKLPMGMSDEDRDFDTINSKIKVKVMVYLGIQPES